MTEIWIIRSTFAGKDEAVLAARALLDEKLIACANIRDDMTSLYRWEGQAHEENEAELIVKTSALKVDAAMARIKSLHTYQVPSITAWKADKAHAAFADWIVSETA